LPLGAGAASAVAAAFDMRVPLGAAGTDPVCNC
jgi:hypothetical protein